MFPTLSAATGAVADAVQSGVDERRIREAFPDHRLPKEMKHYYAREAFGLTPSKPLAHPKDLTRVRQKQESVVVRNVADGLFETQWEALETLVIDGGEISPAD